MKQVFFLCITLFCGTTAHSKPAIFTTQGGKHSVVLSEKAVACSGSALNTLVDADEREEPVIELGAIDITHEGEADKDLALFAQHLELVAEIQDAHQNASDNALCRLLAPELQKLSVPVIARLFRHADFYGVPHLLPALEKQLVETIEQERGSLATQLTANNNPSWLAHLPGRMCNQVLAQKIMQQHPTMFFAGGQDEEPAVFCGYSMRNITFNYDGTKIISAWPDRPNKGDVSVRERDEYHEWVTDLQGHTDYVSNAQFSLDSTKIITTSADRTARIWEKNKDNKWVTTAVLQGYNDRIESAEFSPDGTKVATISRPAVRIWEQNHNNEWIAVATLQEGVFRAQFSYDGTRMVTASRDNSVRVWQKNEHSEWAVVAILPGHTAELTDVHLSPDSTKIVTMSGDGIAQVWEPQNPTHWVVTARLRQSIRWGRSARFSPDGTKIVTTTVEATRVWQKDRNNNWVHAESSYHDVEDVAYAHFSPDGNKILTRIGPELWVRYVFDVANRNNQAGLVLGLHDVLPALQQILNPKPLSLWHRIAGNVGALRAAEKRKVLRALITKINLNKSMQK